MKILASIKRYFSFFYQSKKMNIYLGLISLVLFGFLGIVPLSYNIYKIVSDINDLNVYINQSQNKITFLNDANNDLLTIRPSMRYFSIYMPSQSNTSEYLEDLNSLITSNGFFTERFSTEFDEENKSVEVNAVFYGYGEVSELIKKIEDLNRISKVNSVNLTTVKGRNSISLSINIYYQ